MSARPGLGRSGGGWNRLSETEHKLRGTKPRKPPRPVLLTPIAGAPEPDALDPELLDSLGSKGRDFAQKTFSRYLGWPPHLIVVLGEAARLVDRLDEVRGTRAELATQRMLLSLIGALELKG